MGKGQNPYAYPNVTARYIVNWVEGAKKTHNLTIDFIGVNLQWKIYMYTIYILLRFGTKDLMTQHT